MLNTHIIVVQTKSEQLNDCTGFLCKQQLPFVLSQHSKLFDCEIKKHKIKNDLDFSLYKRSEKQVHCFVENSFVLSFVFLKYKLKISLGVQKTSSL